MVDWDQYYTESTIWKGASSKPEEASAFLNFRIAFPKGYNIKDASKKYPVIIMLHGAGESGRRWTDNFDYTPSDIEIDNNSSSLTNGGDEHRLAVMRAASEPNAFPGIVVFPQASYNGAWEDATTAALTQNEDFIVHLIEDYLVPRYHADINRITMHGLSAGASGTWGFASKRPDLFASILPMSGVPHDINSAKSALVTTPIRLYQGGLDSNPAPPAAHEVIDAFEAEGGRPTLILYPDLEHDTWERAYDEPDFFSWILSTDKRNIFVFDNKTEVCPGVDSVKLGFSAGMTSYQWTINGYDRYKANDRFYYVTDPGLWQVRFKRPNGETDLSNPVIVGLKEGCKLIDGLADETLSVPQSYIYPNPASDRVYIASIQPQDIDAVRVVASTGQVINVPVQPSEDKAELNISALTPGVYMIRVGSKAFKFLKR